jgi:integrase
LEDPHLLICETRLDTGTRISEVTGLKIKHVDLDQGWIATLKRHDPEAWVFPQDQDNCQPLWASAVRSALKKAAAADGCDFPGFGPHSLRRANITWRQEVGGSSIETSQIAGHANTKITEEYTVVQLRRQEEPTRRVQSKAHEGRKTQQGKLVEIKSKGTAA